MNSESECSLVSQQDSADYTSEQIEEVRKFQKIDKTNYYTVLGLERSASATDIKQAYRMMALKFHPDKNRAPGADEVFKIVSHAFSILIDPEKKKKHDMNELFASSPADSKDEVDAEELFKSVFGSNGLDLVDPNRNVQIFDLEGFGVLVKRFLPLILIFILSIFIAWMKSSPEPISLTQDSSFSHPRVTKNLKIPYYTNSAFQSQYLRRPSTKLARILLKYENIIEKRYIKELQKRCRAEVKSLNRKMKKASLDEMDELRQGSTPSCDKLHSFGIQY